VTHRKLDNDEQVFFYEQEFYVLSNFSAFQLHWRGFNFSTSEHAYHWTRFNALDEVGGWDGVPGWRLELADKLACLVSAAPSAHEAFTIAQGGKGFQNPAWDDLKVGVMREVLRAKVHQHEYVQRKLLETGRRDLIEDSWRDDFWGWGEDRDGKNMLGRLWMEIRDELTDRSQAMQAPNKLGLQA
jgi:ribA/ribD-fused uncharacterized protein